MDPLLFNERGGTFCYKTGHRQVFVKNGGSLPVDAILL